MKTDTLFYQLFQSFHTLLFELIDRPTSEAEGYKFSSAEIKEKAFRFDGIFMPTASDKPIFLAEVQFQPKEDFYSEFLAEIFLYLRRSARILPMVDMSAVMEGETPAADAMMNRTLSKPALVSAGDVERASVSNRKFWASGG